MASLLLHSVFRLPTSGQLYGQPSSAFRFPTPDFKIVTQPHIHVVSTKGFLHLLTPVTDYHIQWGNRVFSLHLHREKMEYSYEAFFIFCFTGSISDNWIFTGRRFQHQWNN